MANLLSTIVTGSLSVNVDSSGSSISTVNNGNASRWYGRITTFNSTSDKSVFLGTYASVAVVGAHNNALTAWANLYVNNVDGVNGGNVYLPTNSYVANNSIIHSGGGQTIGGTTYFSGGESLNLYGIRGRFTNEYIHLYEKVGIGHPAGWGQGQAETPTQGLSTYGGMTIAYGTGGTSTFYGRVDVAYSSDRYQMSFRGGAGNYWWITNDSDKLGIHLNGTGDRIYFATNGNIWSAYYNDWLSNVFNSKQNASTAITTSNWSSYAAPRAYITESYVEFTIEGDANTYYPVTIHNWNGTFSWQRYSIHRGYSDTAPWDPIGTGSHKGGLTFAFEWAGDIAWGGNDKSIRVIEFNETYTQMVAGLQLANCEGVVVWLRGGGAYYRLHGPGGRSQSYTINMSTWTSCAGVQYEPRSYDGGRVNSEINSRYPIRGNGNSDIFVNNQAVIHSGNIGSQSVASAGNATTVGGLAVHTGRNNEANKIVRTQENGYVFFGYINSSNGNENNNSNPDRVWGTNGSDDYLRTYRTSALSVGYAASAGNANTLDSLDSSDFARGRAAYQVMSLDDIKQPGLYQYDGGIGGTQPEGADQANLRTIEIGSGSRYSQMAFDWASDQAWFRRQTGDVWSTWREFIHSGNIGSQSVSNADTVDGFHASVAGTANTIPTRNASGYLIPENWIQLNGIYGLYSPTNNAHLRPNPGSYGPWLVTGTRNGWSGIEFDSLDNGNVNLMVGTSSNVSGFHNNSYGWQFLWEGGVLYCHKNSYGGGTRATVLDSSNFTSWAQEKENQRLSTGNSPTFSDIYVDNWFRNNNINEGLYNQATGTHFYSNGGGSWGITGSGGNVELQFRSNHQSTIRGYVYADTSNQIGFLNNGGGWALRTNSSNNAFVHGTDLTINADNSGSSNILMNDGDEGMRQIHCNSNRIGFLTQAGAWGSYCNDDGSWASLIASYAPIYYDSQDTAYYLDPNGTSRLGGLMLEANLDTGRGAYGADRANLVLLASSTYGRAVIDFRSGVNYPSDGAQIYYETATNLSSGETSRLVIRTENDADDSILIRGGFIELNSTTIDGGSTSPGVRTQYNGNNRLMTYSDHTAETNSFNAPQFLVNGHSDNTKGYRIHNTSGSSVSAMFTNSANALVIGAGAFDQVQLNKKVLVSGAALGVNVAASATAGRIDASNDIVAYSSSDERLKHNITPIENALDKVKSLTGVEFDWKPEYKHAHGYEGHDTGIIAQQVQEVIPSAVRTNDTGFLAVRYEKLIGLLIEANKELAARVEELEKKLG